MHQDLVGAAAPAVAASERTPADASLSSLHERLEALEREVAQLRGAATRYATMAPRATLPPPRRTASVELAVDQLANEATRAEVRRSLFMLSMQQVLDQLGVPDSFGLEKDGRVEWRYEMGRKGLTLTFHEGVVMDVYSWTD
ncbi:MAG TPA: hypothetical protein VFD82_09095 [Planctomycetota bacterium]|nr:hypothetical protein [Planctomycetota bacterium]